MGKAKAPRRIPAAVREQIEVIARERDQARAEAEGLREDLRASERYADSLATAGNEMRKIIEDMRKQRDRADERADLADRRCTDARANLYRAMGWIDAKMDKPPEITPDFNREMPF